MYEVCAELEFSAAHFHPEHPGKCRNVHGHNYKVKVRVRSRELDKLGMVCDFYLLKNETRVLLEEFDHTMINDHKDFQEMPPSSENLARYIFTRLQPQLDGDVHYLHAVEVWESSKTAAKYTRPERVEG